MQKNNPIQTTQLKPTIVYGSKVMNYLDRDNASSSSASSDLTSSSIITNTLDRDNGSLVQPTNTNPNIFQDIDIDDLNTISSELGVEEDPTYTDKDTGLQFQLDNLPKGFKLEWTIPMATDDGEDGSSKPYLVPVNMETGEEYDDPLFDDYLYAEQVLNKKIDAENNEGMLMSTIDSIRKGWNYTKALVQDIPEALAFETMHNPVMQLVLPNIRALHATKPENITIREHAEKIGNNVYEAVGGNLEYTLGVRYGTGLTDDIAIGFGTRFMNSIRAMNKHQRDMAISRATVSVDEARFAEQRIADEAAEKAKETVNANRDLKERTIREFEERIGKTISKTVSGRLVVDPTLLRQAGKEKTTDIFRAESPFQVTEFTDAGIKADLGLADDIKYLDLFSEGDSFTQVIMKPEKFDALISIAAELRKTNPNAFKGKGRVIDQLLELTMKKDLVGSEELLSLLNKYNLTFEDYITSIIGSGSEAGKILNKLSQLKRLRPQEEVYKMQQQAAINARKDIWRGALRIENVRRGGLVSQLATASRNLTSAGIRAPLEGFGNVMDTVLWNYGQNGLVKGTVVNFKNAPSNFRDSFAHLKYIFEDPKAAKDWTDYILKRPEFKDQFDTMFNQLNEIRRASRGTPTGTVGKGFNTVVSELEDFVDFLNTPNRWQEFLVRRGMFFGDIQRLVRREYGIDFMEDVVKKGKIRSLINDSTEFKPEGARSFMDIVAEATTKATDVTYAKMPDTPIFRDITSFITNSGFTVIAPFPRFMFNSMELMGQYMGGASIPAAKLLTRVMTMGKVGQKGPLTFKDRQRISRNLVGLSAIYASYEYRKLSQETKDKIETATGVRAVQDKIRDFRGEDKSLFDAALTKLKLKPPPADYKFITLSDGTIMDTTTQYPMRQFLWIGEAGVRLGDGTFDDWFDTKEFTETFIGTNIRTGVGQGILQDIQDTFGGADLTAGEQLGKTFGSAVGNYFSGFFTWFRQASVLDKAMGIRGLEYKETGKDPTLDFMGSLGNSFTKPFKPIFMSPKTEAGLDSKEYLFGNKKQVSPASRLLLGFNLFTPKSEEGEFLTDLGYNEYELGSRSALPDLKNQENEAIREFLPSIIDQMKIEKDKLKAQGLSRSDVNTRLRNLLTGKRGLISQVKTLVSEESRSTAYLQYRRIGKDMRKLGMSLWKERNPNTEFDYSIESNHLDELVALAKAYKSAIPSLD